MWTDEKIEALVHAFEELTLPRSAWTHQAHLVVALRYLQRQPRDEATRRIREGIRRYNESLGNFTGYHETITLAWIAVISRFLAGRTREDSTASLANGLLEERGDKDHLLRFYTRDLLLSAEARAGWIAPDREPIE